mmetsp:Transcript_46265/g.128594  ORF Transcript_46265/g.128594 Transcript_46265/m.128594 type:complete len:229 (+) Transcript_46265:821-1507(+)
MALADADAADAHRASRRGPNRDGRGAARRVWRHGCLTAGRAVPRGAAADGRRRLSGDTAPAHAGHLCVRLRPGDGRCGRRGFDAPITGRAAAQEPRAAERRAEAGGGQGEGRQREPGEARAGEDARGQDCGRAGGGEARARGGGEGGQAAAAAEWQPALQAAAEWQPVRDVRRAVSWLAGGRARELVWLGANQMRRTARCVACLHARTRRGAGNTAVFANVLNGGPMR